MFELKRSARTAFSENYLIFHEDKHIGSLDIHILNYVLGTLIIQPFLDKNELKHLITKIESEIVESLYPRDDFIFTVYFGKEVGFYSDIVSDKDRAWEPIKTKDINEISDLIKTAMGKSQHAKGKINEFVAIEFFRKLGFSVEKATTELDHRKIDIIAENDSRIIFVQVKSGQISEKDIKSLAENVDGIISSKNKSLAIIAK